MSAAKSRAQQAQKTEVSPRDMRVFVLLLGAVFLAGAASLLYEVIWIRQLGGSLGSTAIASSVMLSAFLGGLAFGAWLAGKRADTLESPLMALVKIEVVAAVIGVLSIPALAVTGRAYVVVALVLGVDPLLSLILRALFSFVVMFIPAMIFGLTFPIATAAAARVVNIEKAAGGISAASSFGSAAGAAIAGLYLEPAFGIMRSAFVGAGINLVAALAAFVAAGVLAERYGVLGAAEEPASARS